MGYKEGGTLIHFTKHDCYYFKARLTQLHLNSINKGLVSPFNLFNLILSNKVWTCFLHGRARHQHEQPGSRFVLH